MISFFPMEILPRLIQKVCQPNPKTLKNDFEKEITFKRNRAMFLVLLFVSFICVIYNVYFASPGAVMPKVGLFGNLMITIIFVVTCRSYLFYFKLFYFIYLTGFGPLTLYINQDSIFFNTSAIYIMPLFVLYLMGARPFIIQVIIQILYLHMIYKEKLIQTLNYMDVTAYVHRATTISTLALLMNVGLIYSTQSDLIKAHHQIVLEKLKKADLERQKTFLLSFSHEIRNLINTVIGSVQLSKMEVLTPKVQNFLSTSEICGELLLHLVNNILDSGKVEIGELEVNPSINIVSETLEKVWNICSHQIKSKRLQGKMRIQKDLPNKLKIDNYRLLQILMNLVGNSIKFTQIGKINIDVKWLPSKKQITSDCFEPIPFDKENEGIFEKDQTFSLLDNNLISLDFHRTKIAKGSFTNKSPQSQYGVLKIIVTDTGCGIPQEKIPLIFDKFSQVADDPSKRKMGTGLGLFITKQLVLKMGGEIRVFSKLNHGTAFTVCIPAEPVQDEEIQHALTIESFADLAKKNQFTLQDGLKAMIVDDIEFNLFVLANSMNKLGIQLTSVARNGQEAFDMYKSQIEKNQPLDVVTLDIDMPIMDGKKALKLIRNYEMEFRLKPCLIVMVSANCSGSEIQDCLGSHMKANFFLKKPASVLDFFQVLKTLYKKM